MTRLPLLVLLASQLFACASRADLAASTPQTASNKSAAMVVTANPLASKTGAEVLRNGGSAVDAAVAIEAVLSLVEPQSSGLAGGRIHGVLPRRNRRGVGIRWQGDRASQCNS